MQAVSEAVSLASLLSDLLCRLLISLVSVFNGSLHLFQVPSQPTGRLRQTELKFDHPEGLFLQATCEGFPLSFLSMFAEVCCLDLPC